MKTSAKLAALAIIIFMAACTKQQGETPKAKASLIGTWQLNASYISPGDGSGTYQPVANPGNNSINLKANGTIEVSGLSDADNFLLYFSQYDSYTVKDSITLVFKRTADTTTQNFLYKIEGDKLSLSPAGPLMCIEGCGVRFKKVDE